MDLEIDIGSAEAVYEQIVRQIQHGVQSGTLAAGAALPSIRQLADDLELNHNTVAKAYKLLEGNRIIRTAGRRGTFISADARHHIEHHNAIEAHYQLAALLAQLAERGLTAAQIETAFAAGMAAAFKREEN